MSLPVPSVSTSTRSFIARPCHTDYGVLLSKSTPGAMELRRRNEKRWAPLLHLGRRVAVRLITKIHGILARITLRHRYRSPVSSGLAGRPCGPSTPARATATHTEGVEMTLIPLPGLK